jgi:RsiW-degrading membrane proteinase PrsW (M82 family)
VPDVILTALGVAVGFAVAEDASYVINASAVSGDGGIVALVRSFSAVPLHVVCGLVMGGMIGPALWQQDVRPQASQWRLAGALLLPVMIHGAYDFLLMTLATLSAITICNHTMRHARDTDRSAAPSRAG